MRGRISRKNEAEKLSPDNHKEKVECFFFNLRDIQSQNVRQIASMTDPSFKKSVGSG